ELDRLTWLDDDAALDRAHPHDALIHAHFMDFELSGNRRRTAYQPVRFRAGIPDRNIASRNGCPLGDSAGPGVIDFDRADLVVIGVGGRCEDDGASDEDAKLLHGELPR